MALLFINELINYCTNKTTSRMYVDVNRGSDKLRVNLDIDINHIPCDLLTILTADALGERSSDINGNIVKSRLDKKGRNLDSNNYQVSEPKYEKVKTEISNDEGCNLQGYFFVDAVPGSFLITSGFYGNVVQRLASEGVLKINGEHKIKEISFGELSQRYKIWSFFGKKTAELSYTLKNIKKKYEQLTSVYQYYLKIVPTKFISYKNEINGYQYTYNAYGEKGIHEMPSMHFRYDLSPITVEYKLYKETFLTFIINIFAILGGVFTVTGIIDAIIHKSVVILLRKAEMNKIA